MHNIFHCYYFPSLNIRFDMQFSAYVLYKDICSRNNDLQDMSNCTTDCFQTTNMFNKLIVYISLTHISFNACNTKLNIMYLTMVTLAYSGNEDWDLIIVLGYIPNLTSFFFCLVKFQWKKFEKIGILLLVLYFNKAMGHG